MGFLWGVAIDSQILAGAKTVVGVLIPVLILFKILVWALVLRLSLFLVGGATEEFEGDRCDPGGPGRSGRTRRPGRTVVPVVSVASGQCQDHHRGKRVNFCFASHISPRE